VPNGDNSDYENGNCISGSAPGGYEYVLNSETRAVRCLKVFPDGTTPEAGWWLPPQDNPDGINNCPDFENTYWAKDNHPWSGTCTDVRSLTYEAAKHVCATYKGGGRLPTLEEVLAGCSAGAGCGMDKDQIWTSSTCTTLTSSQLCNSVGCSWDPTKSDGSADGCQESARALRATRNVNERDAVVNVVITDDDVFIEYNTNDRV